jgi:hypothetical protein
MKTQMIELDYEFLDDGTLALGQQTGYDEPNVIHLAPGNLRWLFEDERVQAVLRRNPEDAARERRIERIARLLAVRIRHAVFSDPEVAQLLQGLGDLADLLVAEFDVDGNVEAAKPGSEDSNDKS